MTQGYGPAVGVAVLMATWMLVLAAMVGLACPFNLLQLLMVVLVVAGGLLLAYRGSGS